MDTDIQYKGFIIRPVTISFEKGYGLRIEIYEHDGRQVAPHHIPTFDLYSAYCRKGWCGRVRQNLPPGHANFNRRLFLTTWAIKRSEPFSKLHENRP